MLLCAYSFGLEAFVHRSLDKAAKSRTQRESTAEWDEALHCIREAKAMAVEAGKLVPGAIANGCGQKAEQQAVADEADEMAEKALGTLTSGVRISP